MAERPRPSSVLAPYQRQGLSISSHGAAFIGRLDEEAWRVLDEHDLRWDGTLGPGELSVTLMANWASDGRPMVVKLDPEKGRLAAQVRVQRAWAAVGAAPHIVFDAPGVCIMERVPAGHSLWRTDHATQDIEATSATLLKAWEAPGAIDRLGYGAFWWVFEACRQKFLSAQEKAGPGARLPLTNESFDKARVLINELRRGKPVGACHGDPTVANVLREASGRVWLIDPLPSADPFVCNLAHWASRARSGQGSEKILQKAVSVLGLDVDRTELEGWLAFHTIAPVATRLASGQRIPDEMVRILAPLR